MERGKLLSLCLRESKHFFRARFAHLSKVVVFLAKMCAPVRGIERGKLLSLCSRERGALFQGSLCSPLKSGGFFGKNVCTSKGYGERKTSLASLEKEGGTFSGLALLASQKWCFFLAKMNAPVRGME